MGEGRGRPDEALAKPWTGHPALLRNQDDPAYKRVGEVQDDRGRVTITLKKKAPRKKRRAPTPPPKDVEVVIVRARRIDRATATWKVNVRVRGERPRWVTVRADRSKSIGRFEAMAKAAEEFLGYVVAVPGALWELVAEAQWDPRCKPLHQAQTTLAWG